ncbi:MAG: hypothetical protein ACR2JX_09055 [Mycobacteriales bacterium]
MENTKMTRISVGQRTTPDSHLTAVSSLSPERLTDAMRQAIEAEGLFLLAEVNTAAVVAQAGYEVGFAYQWLFFHPRLLREAVAYSGATIAEIPLKIGAITIGEAIELHCLDPVSSYAPYVGLVAFADKLAVMCKRILACVSA